MVPPEPEGGPLARGWCLWVLTALAGVVAAAFGVWFASGHSSTRASQAASQSAAPSPAGTPACSVDFRDAGFGESDWRATTTGPTTLAVATFTVESANQGGPDDGSYRTTHLVFAGTGLLSVLHLQRAGVYDPAACGRVTSIDASYRVQNRGEPRPVQVVAFAVRQGDAVYTAGRRGVDSSDWTPVNLTGLHETDLGLEAGTGPPHPDFSAGRMEFGYLTANSCGLGAAAPPCAEYQTVSAIAAWQVLVHR